MHEDKWYADESTVDPCLSDTVGFEEKNVGQQIVGLSNISVWTVTTLITYMCSSITVYAYT